MTRHLWTPMELIRDVDTDNNATSRERAMANAMDALVEYMRRNTTKAEHIEMRSELLHQTYPVEK